MNNTIVAPATALINQALSIIRLSGPESYSIINKVFNKKVEKPKKNAIVYGYINYGKKIIDEVLLMCYKKPSSFTGEDMIEINCHGGVFVTKQIIDVLTLSGAKIAERGEFSKQAFLNGKMNLVQADSINNLIFANNASVTEMALNTFLKKNFDKIINIRKQILDIIANIEVNIDYPEYDGIGELKTSQILDTILKIKNEVSKIIKLSKIGQNIKDGINVGIIGKPNVGKSSFLNALLNDDKAIVSKTKGTTRDIVEGSINIADITLNLIDTAGIRNTSKAIEKLGVEKSKKILRKADFIFLILDGSKKLTKADKYLLELTKNKKRIIIVNKSDLFKKIDLNNLEKTEEIISISAKNRDIANLIDFVKTKFYNLDILERDNLILLNKQYINKMINILKLLKNTYNNIKIDLPIDIININLREIWNLLGDFLGYEYEEDILDTIFKNYCLGK